MQGVRITSVAALAVAAAVMFGCAGEAGELPRRMPDVEGETLEDAVGELQAKGFEEILIFTSEVHALDPWDAMVDERTPVLMTYPEPGDESTPEVHLWLGERPEVPDNVPPDAWYYPHGERIAQRGTDPCLNCHERPSCSICHEERLEKTDALLSSDPADMPDVASAVQAATGVREVEASDHGDGWMQVDLSWSGSDSREAAAAARDMALTAVPAGFGAASGTETLVLRWVDEDGRTVVEIGFERGTYESEDWSQVEASDIPWIADRYAVPSV